MAVGLQCFMQTSKQDHIQENTSSNLVDAGQIPFLNSLPWYPLSSSSSERFIIILSTEIAILPRYTWRDTLLAETKLDLSSSLYV